MNLFLSFLLEFLGAFIVWCFKGFKGNLNEEISKPHESSRKSFRNLILSALFIFIIYAIVSNLWNIRAIMQSEWYLKIKKTASSQHVLKIIRVDDADFAILLPLTKFFPCDRFVGFNSLTLFSTGTLWASLRDDNSKVNRQKNHRQFGLEIFDNTDFNKKQKVESRNHFNKRGETEKPDE